MMNFQYFFFDTYPGYFLEALPFAVLAAAIYGVALARREPGRPVRTFILPCLFVAYMTGLVLLTLLVKVMGHVWYFILYQRDSGMSFFRFTPAYNLIPDFWNHLNAESIGNILLFLPFGLLYPFFNRNATWKRTLLTGFLVSLAIELLQPVFGRAFDVNDLILNFSGVLLSTALFHLARAVWRRKGDSGNA